ncbi:ABC transporter permease [Cellulomonas sp. KRMCY2]|uniref:ABC transporter permease n=1 Tax=Cellulomonas sp. KRMCY2 TaxID=1304865 RepID=UPI00045E5B59|nr:ABC transporter permease [Cellulomonas sp. KRMCY2]
MNLDRTAAVATKDLKQWVRDKQALAGPMLIPLALMFLSTILFGFGGDQWNIGLVNNGKGQHAAAFEDQIRTLQSNISPYFNVVTTDPAEADRLVTEGRLQLVVTIPEDFDADIAAGHVPQLQTKVFNINTDMMKNARLRLDRALLDYAAVHRPGFAPVTVEQHTTRADDVWRRAFIGLGATILAIMVGAALNAAIIVAREWERATSKEIRLAPHAQWPVFWGKITAGLVAGAVNATVAAAFAALVFGVRVPWQRLPLLLAIGGLAAITCAGIGVALGAWLRDYRAIQPLLMVTFAGTFFASGGFSSLATLPPAVRAFNQWWPPAYVFDGMQSVAFMAQPPSMTGLLLGESLAAILALTVGVAVFRART